MMYENKYVSFTQNNIQNMKYFDDFFKIINITLT